MSIEAMKQALKALEIGYECVKAEAEQWRFFDGRQLNINRLELISTAIETDVKKIANAITTLRAAIQQAEETRYKLSCGCPSQYGGIPAEWATTDREGSPAIAYGVICEKHWHEYDAQHPQRAWQGLTVEERLACELKAKGNYVELTNAIETKLKEKNT